MGAYHFSAKIHSRAAGASAVRAAAYRAGERLRDERLGRTEDYSRKSDVVEVAILAPPGAPAWCLDRAELWNRVESREKRRDAQLAQEFEINLPRELSDSDNWRLVTDFARVNLVAKGRVCDISFHKPVAEDGAPHPHAHILMPLRSLQGDEFGAKHPDADWRRFFERTDRLNELRREWCEFARIRAGELGIDLGADWDHRSYLDRGLDIEGQPKIGATAQRIFDAGGAADRVDEFQAAARRNGDRLLEDPSIALAALTRQQSTFTEADLARWVHRHSADDQFVQIFSAARASAVNLGFDDRGRERLSTREMIELEGRMLETATALGAKLNHHVPPEKALAALDHSGLSEQQKNAALHLVTEGDLTCLVGYAGTGKSTMLAEVRTVLEDRGYHVHGAALSGIAADNLEQGSGIRSRTIASWSYGWQEGRELLERRDVLIVDEAGMVGSRQMAEMLDHAKRAGSKVILVGDPEQLQAIEAGAAFRAIQERVGAAELTEIRRQEVPWQRDATRELATGETETAIKRYCEAGAVTQAVDAEAARKKLVESWHSARAESPDASRIMLAHTRADVEALNKEARALLRADDQLGADIEIETTRGRRSFAEGERLLFLRNEKSLHVKNGTLGTIVEIEGSQLGVRTDDGRKVEVNVAQYRDLDHGYAVTVHKAQGVNVDQSFVLATNGFDRHLAYVALSRHRESVEVVYDRETFRSDDHMARMMSRERAKDVTTDYAEQCATARDLTPPVEGYITNFGNKREREGKGRSIGWDR